MDLNPKIVRAYGKRLRHRLGDDAARPAWIVNERGVGYRMAAVFGARVDLLGTAHAHL